MSLNRFRRRLIAGAVLLPASKVLRAAQELPVVHVWKSPACGCCQAWVVHLESSGLVVKTYDTGNNAIRREFGMPERFGACHTARISGYVLEGHVPVADIAKLLAQKPEALGLAVPGMPIGSPGMDGPVYQGRTDPYDVLLIQRDGSSSKFHSYR